MCQGRRVYHSGPATAPFLRPPGPCYAARSNSNQVHAHSNSQARTGMHIAIDGTIWGGEETGVAAITRRWIQNLIPLLDGHEATVFVTREFADKPPDIWSRVNLQVVLRNSHATARDRLRRVVWQQAQLPGRLNRIGADVVYCPAYTMPLVTSVPAVVTVHDLIALRRPDLCTWSNGLHLRTLVRATAQRAAVITTPTQVVARDVRHEFQVDASRVVTIPWWSDPEIPGVDRKEAGTLLRERWRLDRDFVLFVGAIEAKKNLPRLIDACDRAGALMVMVGPSRQSERLERAVHAALRRGGHRHLGFVSHRELGALYATARALAIPSHIEGFGLPALEAMAAGCPVIASNDAALREVCGDGAVLVPAEDVGALSQAIASAMASPPDDTLAARRIQRAGAFDQGDSALALLNELVRATQESQAL